MKKKSKQHVLGRAFSSYHGRVHIPNITTEPDVFANKKIYTNSGCAGHIVVTEGNVLDGDLAPK